MYYEARLHRSSARNFSSVAHHAEMRQGEEIRNGSRFVQYKKAKINSYIKNFERQYSLCEIAVSNSNIVV